MIIMGVSLEIAGLLFSYALIVMINPFACT